MPYSPNLWAELSYSGLIFWREAPHLIAFKGTEAVIEFYPRSRDISILDPDFEPSKGQNGLISRLPGRNSKIASVPLKAIR